MLISLLHALDELSAATPFTHPRKVEIYRNQSGLLHSNKLREIQISPIYSPTVRTLSRKAAVERRLL